MEEYKVQLSIFIPTYNDSRLLSKSINSIMRQTFNQDRIEIIVIDDCSTVDLDILDGLYNKYPQIKFIRCNENLHQGGARNLGLKYAQGKYVMFVDADDYIIYNNTLEILVQLMEQHQADAIRSINAYTASAIDEQMYTQPVTIDTVTGQEYIASTPTFGCQIWNGIYRMSFLLKITPFVEHHFYEDTRWTTEMLYKCEKLGLIDFTFYHYDDNANSVTRQQNQELLYDNYLAIVETRDFMLTCESGKAKDVIATRVLNVMLNIYQCSRNNNMRMCVKTYSMCKKNGMFKAKNYDHISCFKKILLALLGIAPIFYVCCAGISILANGKRKICAMAK